MSYEDIEKATGARLSFNAWPTSRLEATRLVVPLGALYTPLSPATVVPYEPIPCRSCRALLNACCQIDFRAKLWICALCLQRNQMPPHYQDISPTQLPPELMQDYLCLEYTLNKPPGPPPIFLYVVDTCIDDEDLKNLKDSLIISLNLLPPNTLVGLITFGTMVFPVYNFRRKSMNLDFKVCNC